MQRRNSQGFTLIELMVVILIIGILIAVVGGAIWIFFAKAKSTLDAQQLTKFKQQVELVAGSDERNMRNVKGDTAAQFFCNLFKKNLIGLEQIQMLAGASGTKGEESNYKADSPDTSSMIIFTGPKDGPGMIAKLRAQSSEGVVMCFNKNNFSKFQDDGMVILMAKSDAEVMKFPMMEDRFKERDPNKTPAIPDPNKSPDFYGKWPFEKIEAE